MGFYAVAHTRCVQTDLLVGAHRNIQSAYTRAINTLLQHVSNKIMQEEGLTKTASVFIICC